MDPFVDGMNKALQELAQKVIPSKEQLKEGKICADKVRQGNISEQLF